ncbi:NAD(P)-dependent oxidoreductase [Sphingobium sp. Sx8-8]|uniref:NAD(P)-dependent oxidoreductase n=1 Tax=Sphingobium sp. Sx8-8 TaxID=2933617 RepID=UPI001F5A8C03|nr:NAD(P)-dependent oxidoreductase [Sphingobium sp. Sx8-8]
MSKKIAILGLGIMGMGMARRLLQAGDAVTVWNRSPARAASLVEAGARQAESPVDAATGADYVIAMVADNDASRSVWLGPQGALAAMARGKVAIDSSTLDPGWVETLAVEMKAAGVHFVEAPVTGSKVQAEGGTLRFFVGSDPESLALARPVLDSMGNGVTHLGPAGSGAVLKLANNVMAGIQVAAFAEALALVEAKGLDREQAANLLRNGAPGSPMVGLMADRMLARNYDPNFLIPLMAKDLGYGEALLASAGIRSGLAAAARARFLEAEQAGLGDRDIAAVVEPLRQS